MSRRSSRSVPDARAEAELETPDADAVAAMMGDGEDAEIDDAGAADDEVVDPSTRLAAVRERIELLVIERPLLTLGIAVGLGFALARLIRR